MTSATRFFTKHVFATLSTRLLMCRTLLTVIFLSKSAGGFRLPSSFFEAKNLNPTKTDNATAEVMPVAFNAQPPCPSLRVEKLQTSCLADRAAKTKFARLKSVWILSMWAIKVSRMHVTQEDGCLAPPCKDA